MPQQAHFTTWSPTTLQLQLTDANCFFVTFPRTKPISALPGVEVARIIRPPRTDKKRFLVCKSSGASASQNGRNNNGMKDTCDTLCMLRGSQIGTTCDAWQHRTHWCGKKQLLCIVQVCSKMSLDFLLDPPNQKFYMLRRGWYQSLNP